MRYHMQYIHHSLSQYIAPSPSLLALAILRTYVSQSASNPLVSSNCPYSTGTSINIFFGRKKEAKLASPLWVFQTEQETTAFSKKSMTKKKRYCCTLFWNSIDS